MNQLEKIETLDNFDKIHEINKVDENVNQIQTN